MKRTDHYLGFMFLTPPWWFKLLHPRNPRTTQEKYAVVAYGKYCLRHHPDKIKDGKRGLLRLAVEHYPLYWLRCEVKYLAKVALSTVLIGAILGIPFLLGWLFGPHLHITITTR